MEVTINGEKSTFENGSNLSKLLESMQLDQANGIAVALNEVVIPKRNWDRQAVTANDEILIIKATQGG